MKRALNETTPGTKQRPKLAPERPEPLSDSTEPNLKSEQRPAPGAFAHFEELSKARANQKENKQARKESAPAKPTKNFLANWRTLEEAQDWLTKLTSPAHVKLPPPTLTVPTLRPWLPAEVLKLIVTKMPARSAANWARTCQYNYAMVDSMCPLNRLPTFLGFFPSSSTPPPTGLIPLVVNWLDPKKAQLDQALYTPLDNRVRLSLTLALRGAIADNSAKKTIALAEEAVLALGADALTALCDLLDEYVRQHESVGIGLNVQAQRAALKRLVPLLLPLLNQSENALCAPTWLKLAKFLPLVTVSTWAPFPENDSISLGYEALLRIEVLGLIDRGAFPADDCDSKLQLACDLLSDYTTYARNASALLASIANKTEGITTIQRFTLENRLMVTRHIVRLSKTLGLDALAERALLPPSLALLALEVELLASRWITPCVHSDEEFFDCLNCAWPDLDASHFLATSMAWRFGRLSTLALETDQTRVDFLPALQAISEKWPRSQNGDLLRQWFRKKQEGADE